MSTQSNQYSGTLINALIKRVDDVIESSRCKSLKRVDALLTFLDAAILDLPECQMGCAEPSIVSTWPGRTPCCAGCFQILAVRDENEAADF